jgi:hypothetical protein
MSRIERIHLDNAFVRYVKACEKLGYNTAGWMLSHGSRPQGIPYQVGVRSNAAVTLPGTRNSGDVGRTRGEAYDTLTTLANGFEDVAERLAVLV